MGETNSSLFTTTFNNSLKVEVRPDRLSSDGGVIILRELDERLGIIYNLVSQIIDPRNPSLIKYDLSELIRTRLFLIAQGWNDGDDADKLRNDPAFVLAASMDTGQTALLPANSPEEKQNGLASQPTLSRLTELLSTETNLAALRRSLIETARKSILSVRGHRFQHFTIDIDSFPIDTYGNQEGSKYNGYYHETCYHPLVAMIAETGDILDIKLRPGNVYTSDGLEDFLFPLIDKVEGMIGMIPAVRGDAGMPSEPVLHKLEEHRVGYAFRIKSNSVLKKMAAPVLDSLKKQGAKDFGEMTVELSYQAESWSQSRRIVLVIIEKGQQDLFEPYRYFFLLTNWTEEELSSFDLLEYYRQRGTMERWIGEFKNVINPALSCSGRPRPGTKKSHDRDDLSCNQSLLLLYALGYNLLNLCRNLMCQQTGKGWSIGRFREQVLKTGVRIVFHARQIHICIMESAASLWRIMERAFMKFHPI